MRISIIRALCVLECIILLVGFSVTWKFQNSADTYAPTYGHLMTWVNENREELELEEKHKESLRVAWNKAIEDTEKRDRAYRRAIGVSNLLIISSLFIFLALFLMLNPKMVKAETDAPATDKVES